MDTLLRLVRWLLGLFVLLMAVAGMFAFGLWVELIFLVGTLILIPPSGAWLGRHVAPLSRHGPAIAAGIVQRWEAWQG